MSRGSISEPLRLERIAHDITTAMIGREMPDPFAPRGPCPDLPPVLRPDENLHAQGQTEDAGRSWCRVADGPGCPRVRTH